MKVVHLNTYDGNGGAGRAVLRLNEALKKAGVHSEVVTLYQFNKKSGVASYADTPFRKALAVFNILAERFLVKAFISDKTVPFSLQRFGISPSNFKQLQNADIIHIHWVNHGLFSPKDIVKFSVFADKKIFWTLHDSNPLTGGCHVRYDCQNFTAECGKCPVLGTENPKDLSHKTWKLKNKAYQKVTFKLIAPSRWMQQSAQKAGLTKNKESFFIGNALETGFFVPKNKSICRDALQIPENSFVILAGYMPSSSDRHKGFKQLKETIIHLTNHADIDKDKLLLLFYGSNNKTESEQIGIPHRFLGKIADDEMLVSLYNSADVFLFPSLEESMGYTALESLSCGTPVVAFNTSGVTDVVLHKKNGFLADLYDAKGLANGILWIMNEADRKYLSENARYHAVTEFGLDVIAKRHLKVYQR